MVRHGKLPPQSAKLIGTQWHAQYSLDVRYLNSRPRTGFEVLSIRFTAAAVWRRQVYPGWPHGCLSTEKNLGSFAERL
jgi:hypothetical protein